MREVEAKDGIARLQQRHVRGRVGLRAGVRLHVRVLCAEKLFRAVAGEVLDHVGEFAPAVVALAGIALGVLVGEDSAGGLENGAADEVLRGDHLQAFVLADDFVANLFGNLRVGGGERCSQINGHSSIVAHGTAGKHREGSLNDG